MTVKYQGSKLSKTLHFQFRSSFKAVEAVLVKTELKLILFYNFFNQDLTSLNFDHIIGISQG